jgi:hypothetical protein
MVSLLDNSVGQIVGALTETGMLTNSIIVFVSDNGAASVGTYQNWGSNYPLRGVRVIFIPHRSDQDVLVRVWLLKRDSMIHGEFCLLGHDSLCVDRRKLTYDKCHLRLQGKPSNN